MLTHKDKLDLLLIELYKRYQLGNENRSLSGIKLGTHVPTGTEITLLGQGLSQNQLYRPLISWTIFVN